MSQKQVIDLAITLDWEHDWDFVRFVEKEAQAHGLTTYVIWPENLEGVLKRLQKDEFEIQFLFDRASTSSDDFTRLQHALKEKGIDILEPLEKLRWASDKATMHLEFITSGLETPFTIILPPYDSQPFIQVPSSDFVRLGRPFIIKPANTTGGSIGVVENAETLEDILRARQEYKQDKYLLQEKVKPLEKDGRRFWFRGFYCCGLVQCAWWNDQTHRYEELAPDQIEGYSLALLFSIVEKISKICKLRFFSTEVALTERLNFIVIDYVNETCDLRLQSLHYDGVPDQLVQNIASSIVLYVKEKSAKGPKVLP
jgi:hypothetical protein